MVTWGKTTCSEKSVDGNGWNLRPMISYDCGKQEIAWTCGQKILLLETLRIFKILKGQHHLSTSKDLGLSQSKISQIS